MPLHCLDTKLKFNHVAFANEKIDAINNAPWFSNVGLNDLEVQRVANWEDALRRVDFSDEFEFGDYIQDLVNATRVFASSRDRELYNKSWGKAHDLAYDLIWKYVNAEVLKKLPVKKPSKYVCPVIAGPLATQVILALVYGVTFEPLEKHVNFFLCGHFPCGYAGEFPDGSLIVY